MYVHLNDNIVVTLRMVLIYVHFPGKHMEPTRKVYVKINNLNIFQ